MSAGWYVGNGPRGGDGNERRDQPLNGRMVDIINPPDVQAGG